MVAPLEASPFQSRSENSLMARLDRFMPVKEIAQIGAAIGREFSYELIAAVAPTPQAHLDEALVRLIDLGLAFRRGTPPDAIYTFKHALVQDAAYDLLLKSRRQELHAKIARVVEKRFPSVEATEPEVLAHHLTAAGLTEAAIPLWQAAGDLAFKRMALTEAIAHLTQGLELVSTLPLSSQRDASELELRRLLGKAWFVVSPAAPEYWSSLHPALALAKSLQRHDALAPLLGGLGNYVFAQGRIAESLEWAEEILGLAKATGDADLLIEGHGLASGSYCYAGEFTEAMEHANKVLERYDDPEKHCHLTDLVNPKTRAGIYGSISTWMLGYPDWALRLNNEKDARARRRGQPFDLGVALTLGAHDFDHRFTHEDLRKRAEECERLGRENSLPFLCTLLAPALYGLAFFREGKLAEAISLLRIWIAFQGSRSPTLKAFLAEAMALTGDIDDALHLIEEIVAQVERPGWEERLHYAEILRLKGWMLSLKGDFDGTNGTISRRSTGRTASRRKCGSCARQRASRGFGRAKANTKMRMNCSPRSTAGSLKASTPRICWMRSRFSPS